MWYYSKVSYICKKNAYCKCFIELEVINMNKRKKNQICAKLLTFYFIGKV